jgi:Domain of unknown function (DUF4304)
MSGSTPRLESSIKDHLSPILKSDGFVGSGRTFRRVSGDLIQVLQVQGSRYGGKFAVNLGIQPLSIPDVVGNAPDASKIKAELCEFRRRLSESKRAHQWWEHTASKQSMDTAVRAAAAVYAAVGRRLFLDQKLHCIRSHPRSSRVGSIAFQDLDRRRSEWHDHWRSCANRSAIWLTQAHSPESLWRISVRRALYVRNSRRFVWQPKWVRRSLRSYGETWMTYGDTLRRHRSSGTRFGAFHGYADSAATRTGETG